MPPQFVDTPDRALLNSGPIHGSESSVNSGTTTPKARNLALPSTPNSELDSPPSPIAKDGDDTNNLHRLQNLRHSFQRTEQSLYALLSRTPISSLNDVRASFLSAARGATRRLSAWQKKHLSKGQLRSGDLSVPEPEWWKKKCHAVPGGNIIIREDDWGSIIAFTLR